MISGRRARVSVGLPVYNGERFLDQAIESILTQSFQDLELIISDNASTDGTEDICRAYAAKDTRIRYTRNHTNLGAPANFNQTFRLSVSPLFKWAAHDDIHETDFLSSCIEALDEDSSVALAYARAVSIDEQGRRLTKEWGAGQDLSSRAPHRRFREVLSPSRDPLPLPIFGVIRSDILRRTRLHQGYASSDYALLAELALWGRFREVPRVLFLQRNHEARLGPQTARNPQGSAALWDPRKTGMTVFPAWELCAGYLTALYRAPLSFAERVHCHVELGKWLRRNTKNLRRDLAIAAERLPILGPARRSYLQKTWVRRLRRSARDLHQLVPSESKMILVDDSSFGDAIFPEGQTIPFLERNGQFWGCPADDDSAISEFDRLYGSGAEFMAFGWPAFWWLDYYAELNRHLRSKFRCVLENDRLVVFDLRFPRRA